MLLETKELLLKFVNRLTRQDLYYMERYGGLAKTQKIQNGRAHNFYDTYEVEKRLSSKPVLPAKKKPAAA